MTWKSLIAVGDKATGASGTLGVYLLYSPWKEMLNFRGSGGWRCSPTPHPPAPM